MVSTSSTDSEPFVPQIMEIVEVIQLVPVGRIKRRGADQMANVPVAVVQEMVKLVTQGRVRQRIVEHAPVAQICDSGSWSMRQWLRFRKRQSMCSW